MTPLTPAAFEDRLAHAARRGYVTALHILRDPDAARDACQEAATRALAARPRYDPERPFDPWFYRILKNHCLDRLAHRKRLRTGGDDLAEALPDPSPSAEAHLLADERERAVLTAIDTLSEHHRTILELRHFQDMSYEDMADTLGCPLGTVMSRLYRARKALREALSRNPAWRR